jgi:SAM-dependent methyltransferase
MTDQTEHRGLHTLDTPSAWVARWSAMAPAGCAVLDVACGSGRHARFLAARGHAVEAVDRDATTLAGLVGVENISTRIADLESGAWPYSGKAFGTVVVTNYLHRPLFPLLLDALSPGGALIYDTFSIGNERYGRPSNPDFLLRPGELLEVVRGRLRVLGYEDIYVEVPKPAMVQRICAIRQAD